MLFQKQYRGLWLCMKYVNVQQTWPTLPRVENQRWQPTEVISKTITSSKIQHWTYSIWLWQTANSQEVYLGNSSNDRQSETAAKTPSQWIDFLGYIVAYVATATRTVGPIHQCVRYVVWCVSDLHSQTAYRYLIITLELKSAPGLRHLIIRDQVQKLLNFTWCNYTTALWYRTPTPILVKGADGPGAREQVRQDRWWSNPIFVAFATLKKCIQTCLLAWHLRAAVAKRNVWCPRLTDPYTGLRMAQNIRSSATA